MDKLVLVLGIAFVLAACAEPPPYPYITGKGYERPAQITTLLRTVAPARVATPPAAAVGPNHAVLVALADVATVAAPLAARSQQCGYWDGGTWYAKIMGAEVRLDLSTKAPIAAKFATLFNAALEKGDPLPGATCSMVYEVALDQLVLIDSIGAR
jgi:hypothetical protein